MERFPGLTLAGLRLQSGPGGEPLTLGRFDAAGGRSFMRLLAAGANRWVEYPPDLWQAGWRAAAGGTSALLYRLDEDGHTLRTFYFGDSYPEPTPARFRATEWYVSPFDVAAAGPVDGPPPGWDELALRHLPAPAPLPAAAPEGNSITRTVRLPAAADLPPPDAPDPSAFDAHTGEAVPVPVQSAVSALVETAGGDFAPEYRCRQIGGEWFALVADHLYAVKNGRAHDLGELPVRVRQTYGEAVTAATAHDFTRAGGFWYVVADTFGNRVVKLDDGLHVVATADVTLPDRVSVDRSGDILVDGAGGRLTSDADLTLMASGDTPFHAAPKTVEVEVPDAPVLSDPRGLTWVHRRGYLYQIQGDGRWRAFFVGNGTSGRAPARILLAGDGILVSFDDRALLFDRLGRLLRTVDFPRASPFDASQNGEGSAWVDADGETLYVIQGPRVLRVSLATGDRDVIAEQAGAQLGPMVAAGDRLFVTADVQALGGADDRPREYTELWVYHVPARTWTRYVIRRPGRILADHVAGDRLVLRRDRVPGADDAAPAEALAYPLALFGTEGR